MRLYKVTDAGGKAYDNLRWGEGVTHEARGRGEKLWSDGFIHAYEDPRIAVIMDLIHGNHNAMLLWEAEGEIVLRDGQLQCGCKRLTTIRRIAQPWLMVKEQVEIGIRAAMTVCRVADWVKWAERWLAGQDRTADAAAAAAVCMTYPTAERYAATAAQHMAEGAKYLAARAAACAVEAAHVLLSSETDGKKTLDLIGIIAEVTGCR